MGDSHHGGHDDHGHHGPTSFWTKYVFSTDHKVIGMQFMFSSLLFVVVGGLLAMGVRYQIAWPKQNVPFSKILPAGTLSPDDAPPGTPFMTSKVAEPNLALWQVGSMVVFDRDIKIDGRAYPRGAKAKLVGFTNGLAVTVPVNTVVDRGRTLIEPIDGFVDAGRVTGDYDYTKGTPHALATAGLVVTVPGSGGSDRVVELKGTSIPRPGNAEPGNSRQILLAIRAQSTSVQLQVPDQKVIVTEEAQLNGFGLSPAQRDDYAQLLAQMRSQNEKALSKSQQVDVIEAAKIRQKVTESKPRIEVSVAAAAIDSLAVETDGVSNVVFYKQLLNDNAYLSFFTMHASIMIFFVVIPTLVGAFGNFLIPLMIGARDMAFPKINMLSFWISVPVGVLMIASFWVPGGSAGGGWTMYPPLSSEAGVMSSQIGTHLWVFGVGLLGFTSILGSLNYVTTIINMRAPGLGMFRMPLTIWSLFITALLQVFATPVLTAAMILLLLDRTLGTMFFSTVVDGKPVGGQPLLFQHLFWFYSHPAVYIMILPAMGIVSDVLATYSRKPIFGYKPMVFAISAIAGLGFIVWGHHMFQSGMNPVLGTTFMASTILIAVPSAIKVFNWMGTLWAGDIRFTPAMLNGIAFVSMFTIGGLSGIFMASTPIDIHIHDTYYIVAHIHYVLFGGSIFGIFAGIYHWFPKMFGRQLNQRWGCIHFWMTIIAFNGTFFLMHILGVGGLTRRYASYMEMPSLHHLQPLNVVMTLFAMSLGMAQLPFLYNFFVSLPRKLGRAIVALFATVLIGSTVIGVTYWTGTSWQVIEGISLGVVDAGEQVRNVVGYVVCIGGLLALSFGLLRGLPAGGKVAVFLVLTPLIVILIDIVNKALTGRLTSIFLQEVHNIMVAVGYGVIAGVVVVGVVFAVWGVGGGLRLPALLQRLACVIFLPAYLAPWVFKPDFFLQLGFTGLIEHSWFIMAALCLPGLAYLVLVRPRDEFGAAAEVNPWNANSLEWVTESPPILLNFEKIPTVYRGPYEYSSPVTEEDYLPQSHKLPDGVVEPGGH